MKFQAPTAETKGFLRRMKMAAYFTEGLQNGKLTAELMDGLIDFLADYIIEPTDREQAKEMLLDASQTQFTDMLSSIMGGEPAVPSETSKP